MVGPEIFLKRTYLGLFNILVFQYYSMASRYADSVYRIHFTLALKNPRKPNFVVIIFP